VSDWRYHISHNLGTLTAVGLFVLMFAIYIGNHEAGLTPAVATTAANKAVLLALVAMAQTIPVLTRGLDLSVGSVFVLANSLGQGLAGCVVVLLLGVVCGFINGAIVVWGRLQPIITTLATGAVFYGVALWFRPTPGGDVQYDIADFVTGQLFGVVPTALVVLLLVVILVWIPYRSSPLGRGAYAVGSNEQAAYMSGVPVEKAKIAAYVLAGFLASLGGLILTFNTYSGEASAAIGGTYTLNSIAAVVIGGTSLFGGWGSAIGSIFGAFVLRTIEDLLFVFDLPPLWQPLFQGVVLLVAISLGAVRVFRIRNRLELFT
jgi:ribose transport system permease protein